MDDLGIIILAGGKSSRMGEDKGLMPLFGKPMVSYVIEVAEKLSKDIIIVSDNANYKKFAYKVVKDKFKNKGPLGGIYSGLYHSEREKNIILSCDVPYVKPALLKYLLHQSEGYDLTVAENNGRIHPLIGVYHASCIDIFLEGIQSGRLKITDNFQYLRTNIVQANEFDEIGFKNLNSKKDIVPFR